ncbi:hypothetical protein GIB67_012144 [Kingdonia uniflora]|uniref:3'-5' exonuclease domain-containing protein n=1 Tax=Kingdonia uniflora TaxID=39325 RepID=A0A7J7N9E1_9MAGN|nr:hypothetical protein GIB67_012144 [Kingdonia uniflora]
MALNILTSANTPSPTYHVSFAGKTIVTTVTDKADDANAWVNEILLIHYGKPTIVVGLDIEWRPHYNRNMSNKSATLQLCVDDKCLILQLFYMDYLPQSLKNFLSDSAAIFVGLEVGNDVAKLRVEYGLNCRRHADIKALAKARWPGRFRRPGLKDLALEVAGLRMAKPKHVCKSNWENRVLNVYQIEYACIDAFASYKIGHKLLVEV